MRKRSLKMPASIVFCRKMTFILHNLGKISKKAFACVVNVNQTFPKFVSYWYFIGDCSVRRQKKPTFFLLQSHKIILWSFIIIWYGVYDLTCLFQVIIMEFLLLEQEESVLRCGCDLFSSWPDLGLFHV